MKLVIYADGGSRGNPGIAGSGTVVYDADGKTILREIVYVVGQKSTNNVAEYHGLLRGLEAAVELGADKVEFHMDSKLVVEQMNGRWKIKHPDMQKLAIKARKLVSQLNSFQLDWVPRAKNKVADTLSNDAMDAAAAGHAPGVVDNSTTVDVETPASQTESAPTSSRTPAQQETTGNKDSAGWLGDRGPVTRFVLLRHGETEMSVAHQYSGHSDPALTERGQKQALAAAQALAEVEFDAIVSSPLHRCQQTAAAVARGRDVAVETLDDLIEMDFGDWEGKNFDDARQSDPELHAKWMEDASVACPSGESLVAVHKRTRKARRELEKRYAGKTVLVVSHVNPIKCFLRQGLGAGASVCHRMHIDLASISTVEFWPEGSVVRGFNDASHCATL